MYLVSIGLQKHEWKFVRTRNVMGAWANRRVFPQLFWVLSKLLCFYDMENMFSIYFRQYCDKKRKQLLMIMNTLFLLQKLNLNFFDLRKKLRFLTNQCRLFFCLGYFLNMCTCAENTHVKFSFECYFFSVSFNIGLMSWTNLMKSWQVLLNQWMEVVGFSPMTSWISLKDLT